MGELQKTPLFRQEVIEFQQRGRHWGRVVPVQPWPIRLTVWFITISVAIVIAGLFFAEYARKETVIGYLTPSAGTARIFAPHPGTISAVHVAQGQQVEEGQPLFSVAVEQIAADGRDVNATILATLERQLLSLQQQIGAEEQRGVSERARLTEQIRSLTTELSDIAAQIALQRERIAVVERLVASAAQLSRRGLISEVDQRRREEALLEQRLSLSAMSQQQTARQGQLSEARFNLEQLPTVTADRIQALHNQVASTEQRIAEVEGRRAFIVRAPIAGRVSSLQAMAGQPADPRRLLAQIIPGDSDLKAELFIPVRAIGFVEPGQMVRILYEAFPYQHFGTYRGRVLSVSQTILNASDVVGPVTLPGPAYRAIVTLERPDVDAYGKRVPLQPDMLLRADVILERRTLVDWLLNPLLSARVQG